MTCAARVRVRFQGFNYPLHVPSQKLLPNPYLAQVLSSISGSNLNLSDKSYTGAWARGRELFLVRKLPT